MTKLAEITKKPEVEVDYSIPPKKYFRTVYQCNDCEAYNNIHNMIDEGTFYTGSYNTAIDADKLKTRFDRIISLPPSSSDNVSRVDRIVEFLKGAGFTFQNNIALDVGSGTCVFLYEFLKRTGFTGHCIDPDPNAIKHALENVGVSEAFCGDLFHFKTKISYNLITFNKVLEHVSNPVDMLKIASELLLENGIIYIELPEGDRIVNENKIKYRAEFAVEHFTVFNSKSIFELSKRAGLKVIQSDVITDPSGKYTIYAFLKK